MVGEPCLIRADSKPASASFAKDASLTATRGYRSSGDGCLEKTHKLKQNPEVLQPLGLRPPSSSQARARGAGREAPRLAGWGGLSWQPWTEPCRRWHAPMLSLRILAFGSSAAGWSVDRGHILHGVLQG